MNRTVSIRTLAAIAFGATAALAFVMAAAAEAPVRGFFEALQDPQPQEVER
jgi:hypothetical protein